MVQVSGVDCAVAGRIIKLRETSASPVLQKDVEDRIVKRLERATMVWWRKTAIERGGEKET
jgi:hypothetical protein